MEPHVTASITRLHLGCGKTILPGWINLDIVPLEGVDVVADLDSCGQVPLPFDDSTIDEFFGSHLFEHLRNPLAVMQELHRIAKPNAKLVFRGPYGSSDDAYEDPTHARPIFLRSFRYYAQPTYTWADYGYRGDWQMNVISLYVSKARYEGKSWQDIMDDVMRVRNVVQEMVVELVAVKPIRPPLGELQVTPPVNIYWR